MENNIFSLDWHYKKYYLGCISDSPASVDLFFYSHEQRYIVKVRSREGKIETAIEAVDEFKLTQEKVKSFCINLYYQKPSEIKEVYLRDLPEDLLETLTCGVYFSFPLPTSANHIEDMVLYDADLEMVVPFRADEAKKYEHAGINQKVVGYLIDGVDRNLEAYPERMVSQLQGKPDENMYKFYPVFKDKKVILLGASYLNSNTRDYYKSAVLFFLVDDTLYSLMNVIEPIVSGMHIHLKEAKNIDKLVYNSGSDKEEFYFYGKEVDVAEYNLINCTPEKFEELWSMGNEKDDLWMPDAINETWRDIEYVLASDGAFAISIDDAVCCCVRILTSKMEYIKGSSYSVKRKRFLQKLASIIES